MTAPFYSSLLVDVDFKIFIWNRSWFFSEYACVDQHADMSMGQFHFDMMLHYNGDVIF